MISGTSSVSNCRWKRVKSRVHGRRVVGSHYRKVSSRSYRDSVGSCTFLPGITSVHPSWLRGLERWYLLRHHDSIVSTRFPVYSSKLQNVPPRVSSRELWTMYRSCVRFSRIEKQREKKPRATLKTLQRKSHRETNSLPALRSSSS